VAAFTADGGAGVLTAAARCASTCALRQPSRSAALGPGYRGAPPGGAEAGGAGSGGDGAGRAEACSLTNLKLLPSAADAAQRTSSRTAPPSA